MLSYMPPVLVDGWFAVLQLLLVLEVFCAYVLSTFDWFLC